MTVLALVLASLTGGDATAQDPGGCARRNPRGFCVDWGASDPGGGGNGRDAGRGAPANCHWETVTSGVWSELDPDFSLSLGVVMPPSATPDSVVIVQEYVCADDQALGPYRAVLAADPESLARIAFGRIEGLLPDPALASDPPAGVHSIVGFPVFVQVTNWTGAITDSECSAGLCVTVTATPAMVYRPGQPGADDVACDGPGRRFDPHGGDALEQASAPGACTFRYTMRTGTAGRPDQWPASVVVTWTITWTASNGNVGSLPAVAGAAALPRGVDEVEAVIITPSD